MVAAKKEAASKKPPLGVVKSVEDFTEWVKGLEGGLLLYRGLADVEWEVETSAFRRLRESRGDASVYIPPKVFQDYLTKLLDQARRRGFFLQYGTEISDLHLLAELQHYGAATCLIDFTVNPLVALWFACGETNENEKNKNGKVVAIQTDDPEEFSEPNYDDVNKKKIKDFLSEEKIFKWGPSDRNNRIIAQQSIFVFGIQRIEEGNYKEVEISREHKTLILKNLKKLSITEETLFRDLPGFSLSNAHNKPYLDYSAEDYFHFGLGAQQRSEYEKAIEYYNEAIMLSPQFIPAYNNRGSAKSAMREYREAIEDFTQAIKFNPKYFGAYYNRGSAKQNLKDYQEAIEDYTKAVKLSPQYADAYHNRGNVKSTLRNYQSAIEDYTKAIEINPKLTHAYYNRGVAKQNLREYQEAIEDYTKAVELDPQHTSAYNNRGNVKNILEDYQGAIENFNKMIEINPELAKAYHNRGIAKQASGDEKGANEDFQKAKELERRK